MTLMERVSTLIRANLNELIERAEHPETMLKQVALDLQNQLMQVKTKVAIAIADRHVLAKKQKEEEEAADEWARKAELAVGKGEDDLARAALDKMMRCREASENYRRQAEQQGGQVEKLKSALRNLEDKLAEAKAKTDLLMAQHRRARSAAKAIPETNGADEQAIERIRNKVARAESLSEAHAELTAQNMADRLAGLEKQDQLEQLLAALKARQGR